jgi:hypothetical protein
VSVTPFLWIEKTLALDRADLIALYMLQLTLANPIAKEKDLGR